MRRHGEQARFLLRVDAYANYPDRYCEQLLKVQARTHADSVVVSIRTEGWTCFRRAAADAAKLAATESALLASMPSAAA
jgi:succinoglycan biosynthesis protein ExoA